MKRALPLLAFFCLSSMASADTLPTTSLFLSPQEARDAERLAQQATPPGQGDIHLGAILFYAADDWALWLQGEKWTPTTTRDDLSIVTVTAESADILWRDDQGKEHKIKLKANQIYQIATDRIIAAP